MIELVIAVLMLGNAMASKVICVFGSLSCCVRGVAFSCLISITSVMIGILHIARVFVSPA